MKAFWAWVFAYGSPTRRRHWRISSVYWMCLLGLLVWVAARRIGLDPDGPPLQIGPFLTVLGLGVVNLSFRSWASLRREKSETPISNRLGWFFVTVDLALVAGGLRFSGGTNSPVWILVFVVVVAETILAAKAEANVIRYGAVAALLGGTLPWPPDTITTGYGLEMALRMGLLTAVSVVTRRLRENAAHREQQIANLTTELAMAEERANLSREVHDGVGNSLAASVLRLEVAARVREKERPGETDLPALLREEAQVLRESMSAVRDWTYHTRPWLATAGGEDLVREVERLSRRTGVFLSVNGAEILDDLSPAARLPIRRIIQEAATNSVKYAKGAACVQIRLFKETVARKTFVVVTISDDGCGFDEADAGAGVGLSSMRERAKGAGGVLQIQTAPGKGTVVTVRLPL